MILLLAVEGCDRTTNGFDRDRLAPPPPSAAPAPLALRLEVPAEVPRGEPVPMRLVLENRGDAPVEVGMGGEPIAFDLLVGTPAGRVVWSRLDGFAVEGILHSRTLGPGDSLEFTHRWDQRDRRGRRVAPGPYRVRGVLPVVGEPVGWGSEVRVLRVR